MKKLLALFASGVCILGPARAQIYFDELGGYTYTFVVDKATGEEINLNFDPYDMDANSGTVSGMKVHLKQDPEDPSTNILVGGQPQPFEATQSDECGNCLVIHFFLDDTKEYYTQQHEYGVFWLVPTDKTFSKSNDKMIFDRIDEKPVDEGSTETTEGEQIQEVVAVVHDDARYYDWGDQPDDGGWLLLEGLGHSFEPESVSSVLPEDDNFDYIPTNAFDDNPYTTWFSNPAGNEEYPVNEYIEFTGTVYNESIWILNGMQYSEEDFENNSRVKYMSVYVNGEFFCFVTLHDQMGAQKIPLNGIDAFQKEGPVTIKFVILETYPGKEFPEAGIAEIYTMGE